MLLYNDKKFYSIIIFTIHSISLNRHSFHTVMSPLIDSFKASSNPDRDTRSDGGFAFESVSMSVSVSELASVSVSACRRVPIKRCQYERRLLYCLRSSTCPFVATK